MSYLSDDLLLACHDQQLSSGQDMGWAKNAQREEAFLNDMKERRKGQKPNVVEAMSKRAALGSVPSSAVIPNKVADQGHLVLGAPL